MVLYFKRWAGRFVFLTTIAHWVRMYCFWSIRIILLGCNRGCHSIINGCRWGESRQACLTLMRGITSLIVRWRRHNLRRGIEITILRVIRWGRPVIGWMISMTKVHTMYMSMMMITKCCKGRRMVIQMNRWNTVLSLGSITIPTCIWKQ